MKIAAHVLAYNVSRFIQPVLRNISPHVDKIYVADSSRPWSYVEGAHEKKNNPTTLDEIYAAGIGSKLEIIEGEWKTEEAMRNACLDRAKNEGFDWLITQDADEFYEDNSWKNIRNILENSIAEDQFITTWYNFWKSSQFVLVDNNGSIKQTNAGFALRCLPHLKFVRNRNTNATTTRIIDYPCFHYGYVMTDTEMLEKISTWGHAKDFNAKKWFQHKWLNWNGNTQNLHPVSPITWCKAIRFPLAQPDFAEQFSLNVNQKNDFSFKLLIEENIFNIKITLIYLIKKIKIILKNSF